MAGVRAGRAARGCGRRGLCRAPVPVVAARRGRQHDGHQAHGGDSPPARLADPGRRRARLRGLVRRDEPGAGHGHLAAEPRSGDPAGSGSLPGGRQAGRAALRLHARLPRPRGGRDGRRGHRARRPAAQRGTRRARVRDEIAARSVLERVRLADQAGRRAAPGALRPRPDGRAVAGAGGVSAGADPGDDRGRVGGRTGGARRPDDRDLHPTRRLGAARRGSSSRRSSAAIT